MSNTDEKVKKEKNEADEEVLDKEQEQEQEQQADSGQDEIPFDEEKRREEYEDLETGALIDLLIERDRMIAELELELQSVRDAHLRKAAELENMKKRIQRDRAQLFESAKANALREFLPINDDLRRTLKAFDDSEVNENFMDGVALVASKFEEVLNKYGVERIDEEGVPFDVDLHDAMMRQKPEDDSIESDMVLKVLENGYRMGDRTIRHAKVIVSE
ncbi:MAG: nucleotide exchange factor GrpE [Balneolaceae bacterium]|nr:nucleotide exchange factor GrpE [Balneolaceae bacterium]